MGAILQHHFIRYRNLDQFANQEEEAPSFEEKGNPSNPRARVLADNNNSIMVRMDDQAERNLSMRSVTTRNVI